MEIEQEGDAVESDRRFSSKIRKIGNRAADWARKAETRFLALLRYSALLGASLALIVSAVLLGLGLVRQLGQTEVEPRSVSIGADDVVPPALIDDEAAEEASPAKPTLPKSIREKTARIYKELFAPSERSDNKITEEQVVDLVWAEGTIEAFEGLGDAGLTAGEEKQLIGTEAVMADALDTIARATKTQDYVAQLAGYRDAKKVNVCTDQSRTRERTVQAWDRYSTSCDYWWESPVGCSTTRVISEPYTEKVCEMKYPEDLEAPAELFAASVQQYADTAQMELESARIEAEAETAENFERKVKGQTNISESGKLFLGFLAVMFLYLFIAMERHNRNLRMLAEGRGAKRS